MSKDYIILLASNGNNIGKSTTARLFKEYLDKYTNFKTSVHSFAGPIRDQVSTIFNSFLDPHTDFIDLYKYSKNQQLKYKYHLDETFVSRDLADKTPRDLVNEYSDLIQEWLSPEVWAHKAYLDILHSLDRDSDQVFIFDDFRRETEYNYLKQKLYWFEFIIVYLDKEGSKSQVDTSYEGQLKDFEFTHKYTFDEDYRYTDDLVDKVLSFANTKEVVINCCYGGYGLSSLALKTYLKYKGLSYETRKDPMYNEELIYLLETDSPFTYQDIQRDDPLLIKVVKELSNKSFGEDANLKVVKIPSKLEYEIIDHDGRETICESYRIFG